MLPAVAPYLSRLETAWLAEQPDSLHRRLDGSLVSADLSGFTALSERLADRGKEGAERLTAMVNGCFSAIMNPAFLEGGDVLKFGGDALLIWFDGTDHQVRSTLAAARMQRAIGAARFLRAGLRMSVGVHSATFDAFLVGPHEWRELVVAGHEVTTTVHLEGEAGAGEVMVGRELAAQLPPEWCTPREAGSALRLDAIPLPRRRPLRGSTVAPLSAIPARIRADVEALDGLGGEHRLATVVFAKVEGTDARIAADPDGMARSLDSLVRAALRDAEKYRLRFLYTDVIADGIKLICTAGAPTSTGEDEESGLRFASDLSEGDPVHRLRIGVNRGRVFAGFLGSEDRRTYTVMGDPVNLAARLMTKAEPGQVVASEDVVRRSRATFRLTPLAPFLVKGKQAPVSAHLLGPPTGERRGQLLSVLPLVGREAELAVLHDGIESAAGGRGQVIEVTGDAGIGKTRLLEAVADDARLVVRIATECQPYDALSPYVSARQLLRRALGIAAHASPQEAGERLRTTAARVAPQVLPLLPLVAVPVGAEIEPTPESDAVAEQFWAARMHAAVSTLLGAALPQTTLLVVEDVYYADDASLRLFRALATDAGGRPWLMIVTRRPEGPGLLADEVDGTVLKLSALDGEETARLTELASGGASLHPLDQEALAQRAGGNPLFLLQLVSSRHEGTTSDDLPESIERVVATRIDRLGPSDRALLRQAAVVGRVFNPVVIDALRTAESASPVGRAQWDALLDLVEPAGSNLWRFRHALFRDVAYEGLPFARRRRMHRAVGELLEAGVSGEPDVARLAEHFWLAGDQERTWRYSVAAGDQAWAAYATTEAIAAYQRALGVRRRVGTLSAGDVRVVSEALGDVLERAARYDEAEEAYQLARRSGDSVLDSARLFRKLGIVRERRGEYASAIRYWTRGMRACEADGTDEGLRELAATELILGGVRHRQGRHKEMLRWALTARVHAQGIGDRRLMAYALNQEQVAITHGAGSPTSEPGHQALAIFEDLGDLLYEGKARNNLGIEAYYRGRWEESATHYRAAQSAFRQAGDLAEAASAMNNLGEVLCDQGWLDEAEQLFSHALADWRAARFGVGVPLCELNLGRTLARAGRHDEAARLLDSAKVAFVGMGASSFATDVTTWEAELAILHGRPERALGLIASVGTEDELFPATRVRARRVEGWAALQQGRHDEARATFAAAKDEAAAEELPFEHLLVLHGLLALQEAGRPAAVGLAEQAAMLEEQLGVVRLPLFPTALP